MRVFTRLVLASAIVTWMVGCGGGEHGNHTDGGASDRGALDGSIDGSLDATLGNDATGSIPDGATVLPDGAVILADGALWNPDATTNPPPDGNAQIPDGSTLLPDGAVILADGALWNPDATTIVVPDGSTVLPDGAVILPDGALWNPDATTIVVPDGSTVLPDGAVLLPDGALWNPDASSNPPPDGSTVLPDGAVILPDGAVWNPDGGMQGCPARGDGGAACGTTEICGNGLDDNCNGLVDEHCACIPGMDHERCYDGCPTQAGIGECRWGTQLCTGAGEIGSYSGVCNGAGRPGPVICGGLRDYRCDGIIDEGCACAIGDMRPCYDGPASTRNVGSCSDGVQSCVAQDGGTGWGACTGEVLPSAPMCDGIDHACDGNPFGGCACTPGATRSCYDGPPGTAGVGVCRAGNQSCGVSGGIAAWGPCIGEITPTADQCDGIDRLCNGQPNPGCMCMPGTSRSCYDGPIGTAGVGQCHAGMQSCVSVSGATMWGPCTGEQLPGAEVCDGLDHLCNGMPNTGCACTPGTTQSCYDGPAGTAGVGLCHAGTQMCVSGPGGVGSSWGACTGEVLPSADRCDGIDRACDGRPNPGCTCVPASTRSCYDGPAGTAGVGQCAAGTQTCNAGGTGWGPCTGEVLPGPEVCDGVDHLCNGMPNTGCACTPGTSQPCYSGPAGTAGVGLCRAGSQMCASGPGGVGSSWGACMGEVLPAASRCDGIDHACTGMPYAGCLCIPGAARSCYNGPAGTAGVGLCRAGMQTCVDMGAGPMWGACTGQVLPSPEICDGLDHLCNGMPNTGCACTPGTMQSCYDGPPGTAGVGVCRAGTQMCTAGPGGVGSSWGTCTGETLPGPIVCDGIDHACDGNYNADCPCMPGQMRGCYDGPAGTAGVGTCQAGSQTCVNRAGGGSTWGACTGEVLPAAPQCDGLDHACAGMLPNCNPAVMCPGSVTTFAGTMVPLTGSGTAVPPSTIASYLWAVISAPSGAVFSFSSTTTASTTFTPSSAGVYTIRFTVTDSMGRSSSCTLLVTSTARSYLGTEFWGVTLSNAWLDPPPPFPTEPFHFAVAIGNPNPVMVTATVTGGALAAAMTFNIAPNSTSTQILPWVRALSQQSGGGAIVTTSPSSVLAANGAYRISTTAPVAAYQFNPLEFTDGRGNFSYTNDASLLLPTPALTGNYIALTHPAHDHNGSFVAIVGTNAMPTTVMVRLTSNIRGGPGAPAANAGTTQTYTLNRGDVLELLSGFDGTYRFQPQFDLSGTTITANNSVAVFAGHDCSNMSFADNGATDACDHLEQQMFPMETWGRSVVVSQLQDRGPTERYMARIMSREDNNTITFIPAAVHASATLNRGQWVELESTADFQVTGTQPILVGQYMEGQLTTPGATVGDPSFVLEVPTTQYRHNYNFVVPASYTSSFINVVAAAGATINLDGAALAGVPAAIAGTQWVVWRLAIAAGSHVITTPGASGFGLKVLGVASFTSYTYPGGLDLSTLP